MQGSHRMIENKKTSKTKKTKDFKNKILPLKLKYETC